MITAKEARNYTKEANVIRSKQAREKADSLLENINNSIKEKSREGDTRVYIHIYNIEADYIGREAKYIKNKILALGFGVKLEEDNSGMTITW